MHCSDGWLDLSREIGLLEIILLRAVTKCISRGGFSWWRCMSLFSVVSNAVEVGPINTLPKLHPFFSSPDSELKIRTWSVWSLSLRHIPGFYYISLRSFHLCELQAGYFNFCEKANRRIFAFADYLYLPLLFEYFSDLCSNLFAAFLCKLLPFLFEYLLLWLLHNPQNRKIM